MGFGGTLWDDLVLTHRYRGGTQVAAEANPPKHGHFLRADTVSPSEEAISDTVRTSVKVAADTAGL